MEATVETELHGLKGSFLGFAILLSIPLGIVAFWELAHDARPLFGFCLAALITPWVTYACLHIVARKSKRLFLSVLVCGAMVTVLLTFLAALGVLVSGIQP
jgi:hypothetical protein